MCRESVCAFFGLFWKACVVKVFVPFQNHTGRYHYGYGFERLAIHELSSKTRNYYFTGILLKVSVPTDSLTAA